MNRQRLRQIVLWVVAADFPALYLSSVTYGSTPATVAALVVLGAAAALAAVVY